MVERIPKPPAQDIIDSASGKETEGYLHQLYFHYPKEGGFQSLVNSLVSKIQNHTEFHLNNEVKKVDTDRGGFFNTEALPEGSILVFPIALKENGWKPFDSQEKKELYFGGLESVGFGRCQVKIVKL